MFFYSQALKPKKIIIQKLGYGPLELKTRSLSLSLILKGFSLVSHKDSEL